MPTTRLCQDRWRGIQNNSLRVGKQGLDTGLSFLRGAQSLGGSISMKEIYSDREGVTFTDTRLNDWMSKCRSTTLKKKRIRKNRRRVTSV